MLRSVAGRRAGRFAPAGLAALSALALLGGSAAAPARASYTVTSPAESGTVHNSADGQNYFLLQNTWGAANTSTYWTHLSNGTDGGGLYCLAQWNYPRYTGSQTWIYSYPEEVFCPTGSNGPGVSVWNLIHFHSNFNYALTLNSAPENGYDVAYDIWGPSNVYQGSTNLGTYGNVEVMIWLKYANTGAGIPANSTSGTPPVVTVDGVNWNVYAYVDMSSKVEFAFIPVSGSVKKTLDLKDFYDSLASGGNGMKYHLDWNTRIKSVDTGVETHDGSGSLKWHTTTTLTTTDPPTY